MENTDKKYLHEIYRSIKKNSLSLFKNIDKAIVFLSLIHI